MVISRTWIRKKWHSCIDTPQKEWDRIAELMMIKFMKADTQHSDPRVHCPEGCSRAKVVENCPMVRRLKLFFAQLFLFFRSVSTDQFQICKKKMNPITGRPVVGEQSSSSFVPSVMKTYILLTDDSVEEKDLLQRYQERIEKLSQQERVIKFCTCSGFLSTVEVGQYFMIKDTERIFTIHRFSGLS